MILRCSFLLAMLLLLPASALALPGLEAANLEPGASFVSALAALKANVGGGVKEYKADAAQEFSVALLQSDLLALLNRAGARHSLLERPAERSVRFATHENAERRLVVAAADGAVEAVLVKLRRPPDSGATPHEARRLAPITGFMDQVHASCAVSALDPEKGPYTVHRDPRDRFVHVGSCGAVKIYLEYHPESDEFWVLYHR